jgi:hypothetical protein
LVPLLDLCGLTNTLMGDADGVYQERSQPRPASEKLPPPSLSEDHSSGRQCESIRNGTSQN